MFVCIQICVGEIQLCYAEGPLYNIYIALLINTPSRSPYLHDSGYVIFNEVMDINKYLMVLRLGSCMT